MTNKMKKVVGTTEVVPATNRQIDAIGNQLLIAKHHHGY